MKRIINELSKMSDSRIRNEVSKQIARGTIGKRKLTMIIGFLKQNRVSIFNDDEGGFVKMMEPEKWDREYLNKVHNAIVCGYFCEDILYHMEAVARKLLFKYRVFCGVFIVLAIGFCYLLISTII